MALRSAEQAAMSRPTIERSDAIFREQLLAGYRRTDQIFAYLLMAEWVLAILVSVTISPYAWAGTSASVHVHVWTAVILGGVIVAAPVALVLLRAGTPLSRHTVAAAQILVSALVIHLWGGRIEAHFLIFVSLAFLALYRDWKVLVTASLVAAFDHFLRGGFWPQSVFGVTTVTPWRWAEHTGWVVFEDIVLISASRQFVRELCLLAFRQAEAESSHAVVEETVAERTGEVRRANESLCIEVEERNRAEYAMRQSEAEARKLALVAAQTRNSVILADAQGRIEWVNAAFTRMTGYLLEEVIGQTPGSLLQGPATDEATKLLMREKIRSGQGFVVEILNYDKSGRTFWVAIEVQPIHDESGTLTQFIGVQEDITARKRAEWRLTTQHSAISVLAESESVEAAIPAVLHVVAQGLGLDRGEFWQADLASNVIHLTHDWSANEEADREFAAGSRAFEFPQWCQSRGARLGTRQRRRH